MSATENPFSDVAIPFRVATLERNETKLADKVAAHDDELSELKVVQATSHEQVTGLTSSMDRLQTSLDKVFWALIGLLVSIATAGALLTLFGPPPG